MKKYQRSLIYTLHNSLLTSYYFVFVICIAYTFYFRIVFYHFTANKDCTVTTEMAVDCTIVIKL